jgi:hypothetical protein
VRRGRELPTLWRPLPLLGLWIAVGLVLSDVTGRVRDWFDMTDELRYERLAISIARTHSLVPRIHGVDVESFSQLYPLLIAPIFAHGYVPHDLVSAHVLNAWLMSSACVPAYLLARRVTGRRRWGYLVAFLSVCMPWILYAAMLMTEVAAYPAFLWALLALHWATVRPSVRGDVLALAGLALAFFARTELLVLVFVAPPAIVCFELGRVVGQSGWRRLGPGLLAALRGHRLLACAYALLLIGGVVLGRLGRLDAVVGVYGSYAQQSTLLPAGLLGSFAAHVALFSLGLGVLPFLVGSGWLLANVLGPHESRERHAFACVASVTLVAVLFQATNFDVRYTGFVHDRFLLYLVPPVLIAMCAALEDGRLPRWSLLVPALVTVCGFATGSFPAFTWQQFPTLTPDSPMSGLLRRIVGVTHTLSGARVALVAVTLLLTALFLLAARRLERGRLSLGLGTFALAALAATTIATFAQFFGTIGWSHRALTASETGANDWIDETIGANASVTVIPYLVSSSYFISDERWRDMEFWNKSVERDALDPDGADYAYTGFWFPKTSLSFDPSTGLANVSPTPWVAASDKDTRFAIAGAPRADVGDVLLIKADMPWRAQWISSGLYDDGWTRPGVTARIRIFPFPGQRRARIRTLAFAVHASPEVARQPVHVDSNLERWVGNATDTGTLTATIPICVPARGYAVVRLSTPVSAVIPGDQATQATSSGSRRGGVFFGETALASEIGGGCRI